MNCLLYTHTNYQYTMNAKLTFAISIILNIISLLWTSILLETTSLKDVHDKCNNSNMYIVCVFAFVLSLCVLLYSAYVTLLGDINTYLEAIDETNNTIFSKLFAIVLSAGFIFWYAYELYIVSCADDLKGTNIYTFLMYLLILSSISFCISLIEFVILCCKKCCPNCVELCTDSSIV